MTAHTAYDEFSMSVQTETKLFAKEALETGKALIDCGATKVYGIVGSFGWSFAYE